MDTSETYIKMCKKAEEIQQHEFEDGDYCYNGFYRGVWDEDCHATVWLPRQDQLQEMLYDKIRSSGFILVTYFVGFMRAGGLDESYVDLTSMEQLWLAFVMKEKYSKIWDGEQWAGKL